MKYIWLYLNMYIVLLLYLDEVHYGYTTPVSFRIRNFVTTALFLEVAEKRGLKWRNYFIPLDVEIE